MTQRLAQVRSRRAAHPAGQAPAAVIDDGAPQESSLDSAAALPLVNQIAYHDVDGAHLWVAVLEGAVLTLDDADDAAFRRLLAGESPRAVTGARLGRPAAPGDVAEHLGDLLGRIAGAGFLKTTAGYHGRREPAPSRFARFHLTQACQLQCVHCYADSSPRVDRTGERDTAWWRALLDRLPEIGSERVLFTGGEALMHRGCLELLAHAKSLGLHVTLFTNGYLIPKVIDAVAASCDQVQVSLDGPTAEVNDPIRGRGSHGRAVKALDALLATPVAVRVGITNMASNWDAWSEQFLGFADRYAGTGLEYKLSFGVTEHGRAEGLGQQLDPARTRPVVQKLLAAVGQETAEQSKVTRRTTGCGYVEQLVVGPDGTVYPCHLLDAPLGHIDDKPLTEWADELTRLATLFSVDHTEGCSSCDIRYLCGGTCRVMNGKRTGSRLVTDCTDGDKLRRYRNLVESFGTQPAAKVTAAAGTI